MPQLQLKFSHMSSLHWIILVLFYLIKTYSIAQKRTKLERNITGNIDRSIYGLLAHGGTPRQSTIYLFVEKAVKKKETTKGDF